MNYFKPLFADGSTFFANNIDIYIELRYTKYIEVRYIAL